MIGWVMTGASLLLAGGCAQDGMPYSRAYHVESSPEVAQGVVRGILDEQAAQHNERWSRQAEKLPNPVQQMQWDEADHYLVVRTSESGHRQIYHQLKRLRWQASADEDG
jgi:hypothetical protein